MFRIRLRYSAMILLVVAATTPPGCGRSRRARYFVLEPSSAPGELVAESGVGSGGMTVGIAPLRVPAYLDRQQIVTRTSDVEVGIAEYHRWAEPLDSSLPRMLAHDLERAPAIGSVVLLPATTPIEPDRIILVELFRFDGAPGKTVRLSTRYTILDGQRALLSGPVRSEVSVDVADASFESLVRAMGLAVSRLGDELAGALIAGP